MQKVIVDVYYALKHIHAYVLINKISICLAINPNDVHFATCKSVFVYSKCQDVVSYIDQIAMYHKW